MKMDKKDIHKWNKIKRLGMLRFVVIYGFIAFGILATVLFFFIDRVWDYGLDTSKYFNEGWGRELFESLIQWTLTGIIWGILMWVFWVRRFTVDK